MTPLEILLWIMPVIVSIAIPIIYYSIRINREIFKHAEWIKLNQEHMEKLHDCDQRIEKKIDDYKMKHTVEVEKYKTDIERKIDKVEDVVDRLFSKMDTVLEKVSESERIHQEIKKAMEKQQDFFVDWIQRIEDVTRDDPNYISRRRKRRRVTTEDDNDG